MMTAPAGPRRRYRIILRGECQHLLAGVLDESRVETGRGWTCVLASVRDQSELYGLLERFQEFALPMVSLAELGAGPDPGHAGRADLDARTEAMVCLAALVAADGSETSRDQAVATALDHGVTHDEIAGVLALLPQAHAAAD
jgi:alkylhydroperoxidase/carboxymuconolactone decarboxylase family protein YurZ